MSMSHSRSRKASGVASRVPKGSRKCDHTVTSNLTVRTHRDSVDTAYSSSSTKCPKEARTPTHAENNPSVVKKVSSDVNPSPLPPKTTTIAIMTIAKNDDNDTSIPEIATTTTDQPTTLALTPALTGMTDDLDTDFQSVYSKTPSPRESLRSNFEGSIEGSNGFIRNYSKISGPSSTKDCRYNGERCAFEPQSNPCRCPHAATCELNTWCHCHSREDTFV